jgi:phosphatidylserine/phosphatidylglycerophosphate/cardiolipin synthase-like enzyme
MNKALPFICLLFAVLPLQSQTAAHADTRVYFSPFGGCTDAVEASLLLAKSNVLVQAYSFTSAPIAKALVDAKKRGVDVQVVLDKSQRTEQYTSATFLANEGVPVFIDDSHRIAHNKVMVIDGETVITGSFNFTKSAEEANAENLLIIKDPLLAQKYAANWQAHRAHSQGYTGKVAEVAPDPAPMPPTASVAAIPALSQPTPAQVSAGGYWMSGTGKRHNSHCRYYHTGNGHECSPNDGVACKICGG